MGRENTSGKICECGCGELVKLESSRFVRGHSTRVIDRKCNNERSLHRKAKKKFGKEFCELCGILAEESKTKYNQYLDMHCIGGSSNYHVMENSNWKTVCRGCHSKLSYQESTDEWKAEFRKNL